MKTKKRSDYIFASKEDIEYHVGRSSDDYTAPPTYILDENEEAQSILGMVFPKKGRANDPIDETRPLQVLPMGHQPSEPSEPLEVLSHSTESAGQLLAGGEVFHCLSCTSHSHLPLDMYTTDTGTRVSSIRGSRHSSLPAAGLDQPPLLKENVKQLNMLQKARAAREARNASKVQLATSTLQGRKTSNIVSLTIPVNNNIASIIGPDVESDSESQVEKPSWVDQGKRGAVQVHDDVNDADID